MLEEQDLNNIEALFREAMTRFLAELRPMPIPASISLSAPVNVSYGSPLACVDPSSAWIIPSKKIYEYLSDDAKNKLKQISDQTGHSVEQVIYELELGIRVNQLTNAINAEASKVK